MSHSNKTNHKQIGVFVMEEFYNLGSRDFLVSAYKSGLSPKLPEVTFGWRTKKNPPKRDNVFSYCIYRWLTPRPYQLTLLDYPPTFPWSFLVNQLDFPYDQAGCVLLINLYRAFSTKLYWMNEAQRILSTEQQLEYKKITEQDVIQSPKLLSAEWITTYFKEAERKKLKGSKYGGMGWIRKNQLPFVVVTVEPEGPPLLALEEALDALDIVSTTPIIRCSFKDNLSGQTGYTFAPADIERALVALIEQIEGSW